MIVRVLEKTEALKEDHHAHTFLAGSLKIVVEEILW